jgi:hypothetical protein
MVDYFGALVESAKDLNRNKHLCIPIIIEIFVIIFLVVLLSLFGVFAFFPLFGIDAFGVMSETVTYEWSPSIIFSVVLFSFLVALVLGLVGLWFTTGIYGMVNAVVEKRKAGAKEFYAAANTRFGHMFEFMLERFVIAFLFFIPAGLLGLAAFKQGMDGLLFGMFAFMLGGIAVLALFLLSIILLFGEAFIIRRGYSGWKAIIESVTLFKKRPGHLFATFGVVFLFVFGINMLMGLISIPIDILSGLSTLFLLPEVLIDLFSAIVQITTSIISWIYLFRMAKELESTTTAKKASRPR